MNGSPLQVVVGIIWRGPRFLAARRPESSPMAGYWEFPGGKIEPGESRENALRRELREELSIQAVRLEFWRSLEHSYSHAACMLHFFHVHEFSGEPTGQEGQSIRWLTPLEALSYIFLPADIPLLHELQGLRLRDSGFPCVLPDEALQGI